MSTNAIQIDTVTGLHRNFGLFQAGAVITLDITTPAGQKRKFRSVFIGCLLKNYVLVQFPDANKVGNFSQYIKQGSNITVRGLIEGHMGAVVAFVSTVQQTLHIPSRLIVLDFPRSVTLQSLRSAVRIETTIHAKICIKKQYWHATIINLSTTGCQVLVADGDALLMEQETVIEVVVEDFQGLKNLKFTAEICSVKSQTLGVGIGVKFNEKSKEAITKLLHKAIFGESE